MPTLETTDGTPVDVTPTDTEAVNAKFRAAMDSDGPAEQAPPKRRRAAAPEDGDAPKPRRTRQPKAEQARTAEATPVKDDYTKDAQSFVGNVWAVSAAIPITQPYALVVEANSDGLASALAEGAKHNSTIRAFVHSGESSWILSLAGVGLTMATQTLQLMKDPELRAQSAATTREHLKDFMRAKGLKVPESADEPAAA
jgi:hypothetical protein